ncbi:MAG: glycosyltransferase family 1 protein [Planctomycetota bacterium]
MKIAFDVSIQDTPFLTGVERVQRSILRELASFDRSNEYLLVSRQHVAFDFPLPENFRPIDLSEHRPSYLWRERLIPPLLAQEKVQIYHSPVSAIPILGKAMKIATVHELPWVERGRGHVTTQHSHRVWLFLNTRYAERIIAVSHRTRHNILLLYPEAADRVVVIHHGVDPWFRVLSTEIDREEFLARHGIPDKPFLFYVGTFRRKKNLAVLLEAFASLPAATRRSLSLVLAGIRNTSWPELESMLSMPELKNVVFLPGYLTDEDLVTFYNLSRALVYPSRFEGFGLPPLEAMACGTPVIASTGGAIPEVVGEAAFLVDPTDPTALRRAIVELNENEDLRQELIKKGLEHVKKFTWRKTADAILKLYQELGGASTSAGGGSAAGGSAAG